jgi:hypothetical protein
MDGRTSFFVRKGILGIKPDHRGICGMLRLMLRRIDWIFHSLQPKDTSCISVYVPDFIQLSDRSLEIVTGPDQ